MGLQESLKTLSSNRVKKGDPPSVAARSDLVNALIDAVLGLARGENIGRGKGIRKRVGQGSVTLVADIQKGRAGSVAANTPFEVYEASDNSDPPYPILKVYPGTIATIMPTLGGAKLDIADTDPGAHPWFYPPGTPFTFFLRCKLDTTVTDNPYRSHITEVKVVTDDDPLAIPDIDPVTGEIPELKPVWDGATDADKALHIKGHFYIKIADLDMELVEGNIKVKAIKQALFSSYLTFVVAADQIIVLL